MEKIWEIKDIDSYLRPRKKQRPGNAASPIQRDPARAYTLSLLFWGAGQTYNQEYGTALAFRLLLIAFGVSAVVAAIFHETLLLFLQARHLVSQSFLYVEVLVLVLLGLWVDLAGDAYRAAARSRMKRYAGIRSRVLPCLCSLLVPGWGQFLNGQPFKGSFFSALAAMGFFSLASIPAVLMAWPFLEPDGARMIIEDIFFVTVLATPLVPALWLFSIHDALLVSLDDYRKEPWVERFRAANNRRRTQGVVQGVAPWIGRAILLSLVFIFCMIVVVQNFPAAYYARLLESSRRELAESGMTMLLDFLARVAALLPRT
jgi:TM2 domain-containing membrane protein YozV